MESNSVLFRNNFQLGEQCWQLNGPFDKFFSRESCVGNWMWIPPFLSDFLSCQTNKGVFGFFPNFLRCDPHGCQVLVQQQRITKHFGGWVHLQQFAQKNSSKKNSAKINWTVSHKLRPLHYIYLARHKLFKCFQHSMQVFKIYNFSDTKTRSTITSIFLIRKIIFIWENTPLPFAHSILP